MCSVPVWEFYHYRRELMASKQPNPAHLAIAACEKRWRQENRSVLSRDRDTRLELPESGTVWLDRPELVVLPDISLIF